MTTAETQYDAHETDSPSQAVVRTVADAKGVDPTDLEPLYSVLDPDKLDLLFRSPPGRPDARTSGEIRFTYEGYEVRVTSTGRVSLEDL